MKVSCPSCQTNYNIDDKRIPPGGAKLKCARCQTTFPIRASESVSAPTPAAIPLPGPATPMAIPLPGPSAPAAAAIPLPGPSTPPPARFPTAEDSETTRVFTMPVPNEAYRDNAPPAPGITPPFAAIPLPGRAAPPPPVDDFDINEEPVAGEAYDAPGGDAIPLPGASDGFGAQDGFSSSVPSDAIPLPGAAPGYTDAPSSFDYAADPYAAGDAVALPPPAAADPYASADPYAADPYAPADPYASADPYAADPYAPADPYAADPYAAAPALDAIALPPPPAPEESFAGVAEGDTFALPPVPSTDAYATGAEESFGAAPEAQDTFALPPPPAEESFAEVAPVEEDPFALPPPPAALLEEDPFALPQAGAGDDFAVEGSVVDDPFDLPPPSSGTPDAFASASSAPPSTVDVGMDFSEPPPGMPMAQASIPDALEFDPTAPLPGGDDLEADLSAPLPPMPNPGAADGLEMLSFIDDAAKGSAPAKPKSNARRYQVRRRSGKVFGPFEEGVVVKMLEDGQLLGNEDVSADGEGWTPIGTVGAFAAAIQKLMEGPGTPAPAPNAPAAATVEASAKAAVPASSAANMERLNQLYGGRMAQVSVVDNTSRAEILLGKVKQRLPLVISTAAAVAVLGVGLGFGATRYGVFGVKKLFPSQVSAGSAEAADVEAARKALLQDSVKGYKQAATLSAKVLATKEYPEVRALWCQSIFYLQRRYSAAEPADQNLCHAEETRGALELLGEQNLEYVKFAAGEALARRDPAAALEPLQRAWSTEAHRADVELALLLAEAQAKRSQNAQAIDTLKGVLTRAPELTKAHHALGNLYQAENKADEAAKAYEAALKADPTHIISAVELAAVQLLLRKDAQAGYDAAERALDEKVKGDMGPAELSRAHTLKGIALFQLFKLQDAEKELRGALEKEPNNLQVKAFLARVLHAQSRFQDALPFYEAVTQADPKDLEAVSGHITTLVTLGKMEDAQKLVAEASKRFPANPQIEYLYGRIDEARDNNATAEEHYKAALKADEKLIGAHVALGRLYLRLNRDEQARAQFEQAATKAPDNAAVRVGLGELALDASDLPRAQEEFARAVQLDPNLADAHLGLSRLALLNGDLTTADTESQKALELDPHTLKGGRLQRGTVLLRLGKLDEAKTELEQAKKEEPRSVGIATMLGAVYIDKGTVARDAKKATEANDFFKEAEINLMLALKSEPSNPEANFFMAQGRAKRGEFTQAIDNMRTAVDRAPKRADYRFVMGNIYRDAKQPTDAFTEWKQAVTLDPKRVEAYEAIGQLHLERNELDDAISAFQSALKVDPQRSLSLAAIGDAHFIALRWKDALRSYEAALKLDPTLTPLYYKVGRSWSEQSQYAKAIDWYLKATTATPDNADVWYHLGYAYKEKGKKKDAVKSFQEYLTRKPDAQDRKEIEDEISFLK